MTSWLLWTLVGFGGGVFVGSFIEWLAHRHILHSDRFVTFAYQLHDVSHHSLFGDDDTYTAVTDSDDDKGRREHIEFVPRDYLMFMAATAPFWLLAEWLLGVPIAFGATLATLAQLQLFNSFHWRYHVPSDTWFQRTWFFRFLSNHHRIHHGNPIYNLNVAFLPLADLCLGTLRTKPICEAARKGGSKPPLAVSEAATLLKIAARHLTVKAHQKGKEGGSPK